VDDLDDLQNRPGGFHVGRLSGNCYAAFAAMTLKRENIDPKNLPPQNLGPALDTLTILTSVNHDAAFHLTPTGIYFSTASNNSSTCTPRAALINNELLNLTWGQPHQYTWNPTSNAKKLNLAPLQFKLANAVIIDGAAAPSLPPIYLLESSSQFGEFILHLKNPAKHPLFIRLELTRDPTVPDAVKTALNRPRKPIDSHPTNWDEMIQRDRRPNRLPVNLQGDTRLRDLVQRNDLPAIRRYLLVETNLEDRDASGSFPLHHATTREAAELLFKYKAPLEAQNLRQQTPLHSAASRGRDAVVKFLLESGASPSATDTAGQTPLHLAARANKPTTAQLLLDHKADINAPDSAGATPLKLATKPEIRKLLTDRGAHE
jgi:hypothetical protein